MVTDKYALVKTTELEQAEINIIKRLWKIITCTQSTSTCPSFTSGSERLRGKQKIRRTDQSQVTIAVTKLTRNPRSLI